MTHQENSLHWRTVGIELHTVVCVECIAVVWLIFCIHLTAPAVALNTDRSPPDRWHTHTMTGQSLYTRTTAGDIHLAMNKVNERDTTSGSRTQFRACAQAAVQGSRL